MFLDRTAAREETFRARKTILLATQFTFPVFFPAYSMYPKSQRCVQTTQGAHVSWVTTKFVACGACGRPFGSVRCTRVPSSFRSLLFQFHQVPPFRFLSPAKIHSRENVMGSRRSSLAFRPRRHLSSPPHPSDEPLAGKQADIKGEKQDLVGSHDHPVHPPTAGVLQANPSCPRSSISPFSPPRGPPRLPPEIWLQVISLLAASFSPSHTASRPTEPTKDDALIALSLTCSQLRELVAFERFSTLVVSSPRQAAKVHKELRRREMGVKSIWSRSIALANFRAPRKSTTLANLDGPAATRVNALEAVVSLATVSK